MKKWLKSVIIILLILAVGAGVLAGVTLHRRNITKVEDYLYVADCGNVSLKLADLFVSAVDAQVDMGCASVRKGSLHARNFDWYYSDEAEFVVRCGGHGEKYASIGVASVTDIPNSFVEKGFYSPIYHALQLYTVDGINEAGLVVNTNIVPSGDAGFTVGTNPGAQRLCSMIIPRYLLNSAGSVEEAVELLKAVDIYSYRDASGPFELHFMISDPEKTAVVEFVDNELVILYDENIVTNFYLALEDYTEHASGIERYDILSAGYDDVTDAGTMFSLMEKVWYSKGYTETDPAWYSENYGFLTNDRGEVFGLSSNVEDFREALLEEQASFNGRTRGDSTWHTVHTSLYDLEDLTLTVIAQENGIPYSFSLR